MDDSVYAWRYMPFLKGNELVKIKEPALIIARDHPRLDGATALIPVYGAAAQAIYQDVVQNDIRRLVRVSSTPRAYEALMGGIADIIFARNHHPNKSPRRDRGDWNFNSRRWGGRRLYFL
jgi:phosphate transport system substrate-binding protein